MNSFINGRKGNQPPPSTRRFSPGQTLSNGYFRKLPSLQVPLLCMTYDMGYHFSYFRPIAPPVLLPNILHIFSLLSGWPEWETRNVLMLCRHCLAVVNNILVLSTLITNLRHSTVWGALKKINSISNTWRQKEGNLQHRFLFEEIPGTRNRCTDSRKMIFLLIQKDRQLLGEETEEDWKAKEGYRVVGPRETSRTVKHRL